MVWHDPVWSAVIAGLVLLGLGRLWQVVRRRKRARASAVPTPSPLSADDSLREAARLYGVKPKPSLTEPQREVLAMLRQTYLDPMHRGRLHYNYLQVVLAGKGVEDSAAAASALDDLRARGLVYVRDDMTVVLSDEGRDFCIDNGIGQPAK